MLQAKWVYKFMVFTAYQAEKNFCFGISSVAMRTTVYRWQ